MSLPLTKLTVPSKAQRAFPEEQPGVESAPLVLSPFVRGGTTSDKTYSHYSLLATIEDIFSLPRLAYAGAPESTVLGPTSSTRGLDRPAPAGNTV